MIDSEVYFVFRDRFTTIELLYTYVFKK